MENTITSGREAAIEHIRHYVERGDTVKQLRDSYMGVCCPNSYSVQIGGWLDGVAYPGKIVVERDKAGNYVNEVFKIEDIYNLIKCGQTALF